jgi:integrase
MGAFRVHPCPVASCESRLISVPIQSPDTRMHRLTDLEVRRLIAKAKRSGLRTDVRDEGSSGLELRAGPRGGVWRLKYVDGRSRKQERVILGHYPQVGLSEARRRADEEKARIRDPRVLANPAREVRDRSAAPTFRELAERRLHVGDLAQSTRAYYRWCIDTHANPILGDVPAKEVRPEDIIAVVDSTAKETPTTADRTKAAISSVFSWALGERILASNPAAGIARRAANIPRDRTPGNGDLRLLLQAIRARRSDDLRRVLHLLLLTGARNSEVRLCESGDLHWEGYAGHPGPIWVVPGDRLEKGRRVRGRSKSGRAIVRPLSDQAAELFREATANAGGRARLFEVSERRAVSTAMTRCCADMGLIGSRNVTAHDFRRALSSWLGDFGERPDVIAAILGHAPVGVTRTHYNHSLMLPLVSQALQRWADHLDELS